MDATELGRWSRFAAKGGIGKCTALQDYVAEEPEDLMFMKDDEITVLMQLGEQEDAFLGYCEGVIGRFRASFVRFHSRLKKPVMTKRTSTGSSTSPSYRSRSRSHSHSLSRPSSSQSASTLAARDIASPPVPFQGSPVASRSGSPRRSLTMSTSSSIALEMNGSGSTGMLAHSSSTGSVRAPSPLRLTRSAETPLPNPHAHPYPERSTSYSSSRSATLESAPPATPASGSPDEEEYTVRIAVHSRDHPEQLSPVVRESVLFGEAEEDGGSALTPGQITSPLNIRKSPSRSEHSTSPQPPVPSDPPMSPVPSVVGSDASPRSFSFGVDESEDSSRLSLDMSAGVEGIGLSLLQGFISGGANDDDDASILSSGSGGSTPNRDPDHRRSTTSTINLDMHGGSPADSPHSATQSVSRYSRSPSPTPSPVPHTESFLLDFHPPNPPYAHDSQRSSMQSLKSMRSLQSLRPSLAGSEHSGGSGSGWEGDIYDDYRYSRFSMASKVSRLSQSSIRPAGDIPPMPSEHPASKMNMVESSVGLPDEVDTRPPAAVVVSSESGTVTSHLPTAEEDEVYERSLTLKEKDRPSPLSFTDTNSGHSTLRYSNASTAQAVSPLLHASFGSPTQSATPKTPGTPVTPASMYSFASAPPSSPEQQRSSNDGPSPPRERDVRRASGQAIVDEDDEEPLFGNAHNAASPTSLRDQSTFASTKAREAAERAMSPSDEPAPPPYVMSGPSAYRTQPVTSPPPVQGPPLLRTRSSNQPHADSAARTSLFMPHPHAPKPAQVPAGPMYGRQPAPFPPPQQYTGPPPDSAVHIIHSLLAQQQQGRRHGGTSTIFARFDRDLATSMGPVPISFSLEPQMNVPANRPTGFDMHNQGPGSRAGSPAAAPSRVATPMDPSPYDIAATMAQGSNLSRSATASPAVRTASPAMNPNLARSATASPRPNNASPPVQGDIGRPDYVSSGKVIPRPNFFPKAATPRPRSRSFSGFDSSPAAEVIIPKGDDTKDGPSSAQIASVALITKRSKSATATPVAATSHLSVPTPQRATLSHTSSVVRGVQRPSPLSLSQNNVVAGPSSANTPFAGRPMLIPAVSSAPGSPVSRATFDRNGTTSALQQRDVPTGGSSVRHPSTATLKSEHSASPSSPPSSPRSPASPRSSFPVIRHSRSSILLGSRTAMGDPALPPSPRAPVAPRRPSIESSITPPRPSVESSASRQSTDSVRLRRPSQLSMAMKVSSTSPDVLESGSSGTAANASSLRSEISSSGLRVQTMSERPLLQPNERSPASSVFSFDHLEHKVHVSVKDMDFELVAPSAPRSPLATSSADSLLIPGANANAKSVSDASPLRRLSSDRSTGGESVAKVTDAAEVEAHRQRELRWISALSSTPPSQARRTKRIRKLVLEGVPASVRYRVWAHLTDSKAKRMEGLYARLGQRERVAPSANIQQDAQRIFHNQPLLDQSLVNVLQAYLTMVPDVQYTKGLAMIAGQLLLQSPEEDAFWTFVTMMDSHIRPYFSPQPVLLEIDSSLFSKAMESNDAALAQRILVEMAIPPICICRPWFTALFADAFSPDFLLRVWDVFLFEGVAFLFRVGLAVIIGCRQALLQCRGQEQLLAFLAHPPPNFLPPTPEAFIEFAFSVKLRDDDIYKQRHKLEAQLKRQMQTRSQLSASRVSTPTISLPRS